MFALKRITAIISKVEAKYAATGFGGAVGNKGGVSVAFNLGETRLCFLSCHLTSMQDKVEERNADFAAVTAHLTGAVS